MRRFAAAFACAMALRDLCAARSQRCKTKAWRLKSAVPTARGAPRVVGELRVQANAKQFRQIQSTISFLLSWLEEAHI